MTKKGSKCKRSATCKWHKQETCPICLDEVQPSFKTNHITSCGHSFHSSCIMKWFETSDCCPVCRSDQPNEPFILFKNNVKKGMESIYMDAIRSLEEDVTRYRRRIRALRDL
jgi:hypothetical protein